MRRCRGVASCDEPGSTIAQNQNRSSLLLAIIEVVVRVLAC